MQSKRNSHLYLTFNMKVLKLLRLWTVEGDNENSLSSKFMRYSFIISLFPTMIPLMYDFVMQTLGKYYLSFV